jgi:hypothetical protein
MPKKKKEKGEDIYRDISEVLGSFDDRLSNLEERVSNIEATLVVAGPEMAKVIYSDEEGYRIVHGGYYGEYVVITPEGEEYHYSSYKLADKALDYLKFEKSKK